MNSPRCSSADYLLNLVAIHIHKARNRARYAKYLLYGSDASDSDEEQSEEGGAQSDGGQSGSGESIDSVPLKRGVIWHQSPRHHAAVEQTFTSPHGGLQHRQDSAAHAQSAITQLNHTNGQASQRRLEKSPLRHAELAPVLEESGARSCARSPTDDALEKIKALEYQLAALKQAGSSHHKRNKSRHSTRAAGRRQLRSARDQFDHETHSCPGTNVDETLPTSSPEVTASPSTEPDKPRVERRRESSRSPDTNDPCRSLRKRTQSASKYTEQ